MILHCVLIPLILTSISIQEELFKSVAAVPPADDTLIFVQVLFRHGHRAPTIWSTYHNDPHRYASYWPYNEGDLLKEGMKVSYRLGLELRQRYGKFLGKTYNSHLVGALSSSTGRCQESLQCVLAGMFPPNKDELFLSDLPWRPIAFDILPKEKDDIFRVYDCPDYWKISVRPTNQTYLDLLDYLTFHIGATMNDTTDLFAISDAINVQKLLGKQIPKWVDKIYPEPLISSGRLIYNDILKIRMEIGGKGLFRQITKVLLDKLNGTLSPPRRKMMLYAAHEQTIVFALGGIKGYTGQAPDVGTYVAIELHYINGAYGVKMYFQNYVYPAPQYVNVLGYGEFCPLDKFMDGVRWLVQSRKGFCEF